MGVLLRAILTGIQGLFGFLFLAVVRLALFLVNQIVLRLDFGLLGVVQGLEFAGVGDRLLARATPGQNRADQGRDHRVAQSHAVNPSR